MSPGARREASNEVVGRTYSAIPADSSIEVARAGYADPDSAVVPPTTGPNRTVFAPDSHPRPTSHLPVMMVTVTEYARALAESRACGCRKSHPAASSASLYPRIRPPSRSDLRSRAALGHGIGDAGNIESGTPSFSRPAILPGVVSAAMVIGVSSQLTLAEGWSRPKNWYRSESGG